MQPSNLVRLALRVRTQACTSRFLYNKAINTNTSTVARSAAFSSWADKNADAGATTSTDTASSSPVASSLSSDVKVEKVRVEACGDIDSDDEDDEMEQEEMFVEAYESPSFDHGRAEWGGPRRGGRLPEPTRFGDWERKGRCSDF